MDFTAVLFIKCLVFTHANALIIRVQCDYSISKRRQLTASLSKERPVPLPLPENNRWAKSLT